MATTMLRTREELVDDLGREWLFETEIHNGYAQVYVTAPGEPERRQLTTRRAAPSTRPSLRCDADEALPLDLP